MDTQWLPGWRCAGRAYIRPRSWHHPVRRIAETKAILAAKPDHEEVLNTLDLAEQLANSPTPSQKAITQLGAGWIAEEALAVALYCSLVADNFRQGVLLAVNHSGDSDSTGSIAGNLLGAMHGDDAIPSKWLRLLELNDLIGEVADDLFEFPDWPIDANSFDEATERIWDKYPGF